MINTLVTHKTLTSLGIGCISAVFNNKKVVRVNFGLDDAKKCKIESLNIIDTSQCKTVTFNEFRNRILSDKSTLNQVIIGNELKEYVGIGWITLRVVTTDDLTKYPRAI